MRNAKVMQRSRSFPGRNEFHGEKSMKDLSFDHKTTFTMGKLVPFLVKETLPSDDWYIRAEIMMRFAPLYLPIMHRVNLQMDYFYIPNRIMWPNWYIDAGSDPAPYEGWENFIFNPESGLEHPYYEVLPYDYTAGFSADAFELVAYMGFPTMIQNIGAVATFQINAFPINAYYAVYDQYYRNDQLQDKVWRGLGQGLNTWLGEGAPHVGSCLRRNWNRDTFTSATYEPQLGAEVVIPMLDSSPDLPVYERWRKSADGSIFDPASSVGLRVDTDGRTYEDGGNMQVYPDLTEIAAPIAELRYALMLQEWAERANRAGDRYSDNMYVFFDENPLAGVIQVPVWLGSKKGKVIVSEVLSTTETATLKVGSYAGQALALENTGDVIEYHCKEHGIILGIISVFPDSSYMQGAEPMWWRKLSTDYAWPQFALIGDQAILNREVNLDIRNAPPDANYNTDVFGYNRRYYEYQYSQDVYSGLMRTTFISFHIGRLLSVTDPEDTVLDSDFIICRPDVTRVFQVSEDEDEIYAHIYNDLKVMRRLPKEGIPNVA